MGWALATHGALVGSKPGSLDFELALRGPGEPVVGPGKPPQELTPELSPEGRAR